MKVITGGQTGVDQAALRAAQACGLETGGWAPKGWKTEEGPAPWLADFGLEEHASRGYRPRTEWNVNAADFALILGRWSNGSALTDQLAVESETPCYWLIWRQARFVSSYEIAPLLHRSAPSVLMVAGNRESVSPGIGEAAEALLLDVFRALAKGSG